MKTEHTLNKYSVEVYDTEAKIQISLKWDGCCNIWRYFNGEDKDKHTTENTEYMHLCDVPHFIRLLKQTLNLAQNSLDTWDHDLIAIHEI